MSKRLVSTLSVGFDEDNDENGDGLGDNAGRYKITLQQMTKRFDYAGQLWARCFPSSGVHFTASQGSVRGGEVRSMRARQSVTFSNSSSATLNYPNATNVSIGSSLLMKKTKDVYGRTRIVPASEAVLRFDAESASIKAETYRSNPNGMEEIDEEDAFQRRPIAIYGSCFLQYDVLYKMLYYTPGRTSLAGGGAIFYVGDIYAWNDYDVAVQPMELDLNSSPDWVEYARVTSKIVLDAKGVWEFPPNWESTYQSNKKKSGDQRSDYAEPGQFPGHSHEIDPDNSFVDVRVHEIIEVNTMSTLMYKSQNGDSIYAPYWGSSNSYIPKYEVKFSDPPGGAKASSADDFKYDLNNRTWRDVFLEVDKAEVLDRLQSDYPGVTEE